MKVQLDAAAIEELGRRPEVAAFVEKVATGVRNQARDSVKGHYPGTKRGRAIAVESGRDEISAYSDVGYTKTHPGFVLWWSEVGTQKMSPRPHLRAALNQVRL